MSVTLAQRLDQIEARLARIESFDQIEARFTRIEKLLNAEPISRAVTGSDIVWKNGYRPHFWHDLEVRAEVIALYRAATLDDAAQRLAAKFGSRAPSRSGIQRIWQKIDKQRRAA